MTRVDPVAATVSAGNWRLLPPRDTDAAVICQIADIRPQRIENGFCGMCDTSISQEWCVDNKKPHYEIRHLADHDIGVLRPTELVILENWLASGEVRRAGAFRRLQARFFGQNRR